MREKVKGGEVQYRRVRESGEKGEGGEVKGGRDGGGEGTRVRDGGGRRGEKGGGMEEVYRRGER